MIKLVSGYSSNEMCRCQQIASQVTISVGYLEGKETPNHDKLSYCLFIDACPFLRMSQCEGRLEIQVKATAVSWLSTSAEPHFDDNHDNDSSISRRFSLSWTPSSELSYRVEALLRYFPRSTFHGLSIKSAPNSSKPFFFLHRRTNFFSSPKRTAS
jgi:hypothetical protein